MSLSICQSLLWQMPVCEALTIDERSQDGRLGEVYAFVGAVDLGRVRLRDNRGAFSTHRVLARQAALSRRVVAARSVETAASVCRGLTEFVRSGARDVPFNHDSHRSAGCHGRPAVAGGRRRNREIFAGASARPSSCLGAQCALANGLNIVCSEPARPFTRLSSRRTNRDRSS